MRNLTIQRTKSFVGCLGKFKVYIEDHNSSELEINGVPCRKLGELKNGEEKTFSIDENAQKVFVIADKMSRNYCNDFFNIPAGDTDMYLSGKSHFSPASGNAFRFDGVTDEEVLENRKKSGKKGGLVTVIAVVLGFIMGFLLMSMIL